MSSLSDSPVATDSPAKDAVAESVFVRPVRCRWFLVLAGLAGAALGWWVLETRVESFPVPEELEALSAKRRATMPMSQEENDRHAELSAQLDRKNAAAAWVVIGVPVAALVGATAGVLIRSWAMSLAGLFVGAILGGALGGAAGWTAALVYQTLMIRVALEASYSAMAAHAVGWSLLAIAIALTVWLVTRRPGVSLLRVAGTAVASGLVAALLFPIIAAVAFPMSNSDLVIPSGHWNRLVWVEFAAAIISLGIVRSISRPKPLVKA
ncbi:MAG: hypothetical protein M3552_07435 [Planctomycetota bacterium]|nr:hypothetical protein [Planctomycetaceae bacterium]MDQ3330469.1 hypothetical protein [Planctomycetota bacterium]